MTQRRRLSLAWLVLGSGLGVMAPAWADARLAVVFNDPGGAYAPYYADIERVALAAGADWLARFVAPASTLTLSVSIGFAPIGTATGRSVVSSPVGSAGGLRLYDQGAAYELRTGIDPNGAAADIEVLLGSTGYLQNELWFDPDPSARLSAVPGDRTDAYSVLLHEFGHALGFNGWRDATSGALPGAFASTFDALVQGAPVGGGTALYFTGANAMAAYGGAVPMTMGNYAHFGNWGGASAGAAGRTCCPT